MGKEGTAMSSEIIPIIDRRPEFVDKPGTHALIVGVSAYSHLEGGTGTQANNTYGLKQLSSTALTAYKVFSWLQECKLETPLVTCRLLLSSSPIEQDIETGLRDLRGSYPATRDHFDCAAYGWRDDAESHKKNVTFFYFAGHGIQQINSTNYKDPILLMEDFGRDKYKTLGNTVDTQNLVDGMKDVSARTQMYFFDCCRNFLDELKNIRSDVPPVWDAKLGVKDDRLAPVFYAALLGDVAYGIKGEQTYFGEALLKCLEGGAGECKEFEKFDGEERWYISIDTLCGKIKTQVNDLNKRKSRNQDIEVDRTRNRDEEEYICFLDGPPSVDVIFKVEPPEARQYTRVEIFNDNKEEVTESEPPIPLEPHPYSGRLDAGYYTINARIKPPQRNFQDYLGKHRPVMPPCYVKNMKVEVKK